MWALRDAPPYATLLLATTSAPETAAATSGWRAYTPSRLMRSAFATFSGGGVPHEISFAPSGKRLAALTLQLKLLTKITTREQQDTCDSFHLDWTGNTIYCTSKQPGAFLQCYIWHIRGL